MDRDDAKNNNRINKNEEEGNALTTHIFGNSNQHKIILADLTQKLALKNRKYHRNIYHLPNAKCGEKAVAEIVGVLSDFLLHV